MQQASDLGPRLARLNGDVKLNPARLAEIECLDLSSQEDDLWIGLGHLCRRDWWERTWVIQEVALAVNQPVILCGQYGMTWDDLSVMLIALEDTGVKSVFLNAAGQLIRRDNANAFTTVAHINIFRSAVANGSHGYNLLPLLQITRLRRCSVDVDRIYGMHGLMKPALREAMRKQDFVKYPSQNGWHPTFATKKGTMRHI